MARIKIISDPYENKITYMKWNDNNGGSWETINNENSKLLNEKFTGGVFTFNVKKIVDIIYDEFRIGNDVIFLLFEGTNDEYNELKTVCMDECYNGLIRPKKALRYLRNARDILPEVKEIFDLMQPLIDESVKDDSKIAREKQLFKDVTKTDIPICVLGNYSSGKSTFINSLIGYEVLPSGDDPLTAKIHRIERSQFDDRASVCFDYKDNRVRITFEAHGMPEFSMSRDSELYTILYESVEPYSERSIACRVNRILEAINSGDNAEIMRDVSDMIEISVPFNKEGVFGSSLNKFVIFDTPGSNAASNLDHIKVLKKAMVDLSNGLPVYVSEYNSLDTTDNEKLCSEIKNMPELDSRFSMIIVNKADDANLKNFNEERLLHQAIPRQLYSGGVYFVSSIMGLGSKNNGKFRNEFYEDVFDRIKDRFIDPNNKFYKTLYTYDIMAEQIKQESLQKSQRYPNRILANSGLYWIEEEIETFAGKYSPYNKCQQSRLFLNKVISITLDEIEKSRQVCEDGKHRWESDLESGKADIISSLEEGCDNLQTFFFNQYDKDMASTKAEGLKLIEKDELIQLEHKITEAKTDETSPEPASAAVQETASENTGKRAKINLKAIRESLKEKHEKIKQAHDKQLEIENMTSDELLVAVRNKFSARIDHVQKILNSASVSYWTEKTEQMKVKLATLVTGSEELTDAEKSEISDIILTYDHITFEEQTEKLFTRSQFEKRYIMLFGIRLFENKKLDLNKLTKAYNKELKGQTSHIYNMLKESHENNFRRWTDDLLKKIRENVTDYNSDLHQLTELISEQERTLRELESRRKRLIEYSREIEEKMSWQMRDSEDPEDEF
ncbi:dynamin family protein [Ruminococcus albus]|uniref:Dynamin family protein n=1 Tax=Ruminococcus albus TaxID=1264 RepID=A0A1H7Q5H9_RUMAL|nr:dynamin family protein [Ruminococcus albus]SEL42924.1 Dynamin family protein [Ruminococcus albus]